MQSALANIEGVSNLKVELGKVEYSGTAKAAEVIAVLEEKTKFKAEVQ